jgi:hypothetical protein
MLNVVMLSIVMLNVVMLNVVMLNVVMLNVVMLIVVAPKNDLIRDQSLNFVLESMLKNFYFSSPTELL